MTCPFEKELDLIIQLHQQGDYDGAATGYDKLLTIAPNTPHLKKLRAKLFTDCGEPEQAIPILQEIAANIPSDTLALYYLAEAYMAGSYPNEAVSILQALLEKEPRNQDALYLLGCAFVTCQNSAFALEIFDLLCQINPEHSEALNYLGILRQEQGEIKLAEHYFRQAIKAYEQFPEAHINLGNLLAEQGSADEACNHFSRALVIMPQHPDALFNLAVFQQSRQRSNEAIVLYRQLIALYPEHVDAMNNLGLLLDSIGQSDEAETQWKKALRIDANYVNALFNLGNLAHARQNSQLALDYYQQILAIQPDNISARYLVNALTGSSLAHAPDHYIKDLFDSFAPAFEKSLIDELEYRTPEILSILLYNHLSPKHRFTSAIDLGCGTGLMGVQIAPRCDQLIGVDLSPEMLRRAANKKIYHSLHEENLITFLQAQKREYDLITATDVFVYLGDLEPVFAAVSQVLLAQGYFLFSTEKGRGDDFSITYSGRFTHSARYIRQLAKQHGFQVIERMSATVRKENRKPVIGDCFLLERI